MASSTGFVGGASSSFNEEHAIAKTEPKIIKKIYIILQLSFKRLYDFFNELVLKWYVITNLRKVLLEFKIHPSIKLIYFNVIVLSTNEIRNLPLWLKLKDVIEVLY